ncbi:hypothetical protein EY643_07210 [Halioglobus maricola]|uniref:Anti-sigma factor n=1 Tax=Halioglobus maricola TaxID=2601894 RepID=A0A5P9NI36_9GAMM|nr:hypothetical protein [Halioglobus maricola]QFU75461.1 hypothetical protein EY643_07210 [Halioglobus maricola]
MNEQDNQQLSQYLDGELDVFSSRALEQRLQQEPELAATLDRMKGQDVAIRSALQQTAEAPASVRAMLTPASNVVALPQRKARPAWQYAIAASLVAAAGLAISPTWQSAPNAQQMLAEVLETSPSMASGWETLDNGSQVRPVLSFKDNEGNWCREFLITEADEASRGVSCREAGEWQTQVLAATEIPGDATQFRPAGATDADSVANFLADQTDSIPLSAAEEAALIENHWN